MPFHVSKPEFAAIVEKVLDELPEPFKSHLEEMRVEILDRPTPRQLRDKNIGQDEILLGLYVGHAITDRTHEVTGMLPDVIYIFQENIERISESRRGLGNQVRITVLHEIGHHFGLDENGLNELGYG